jgi:hypothetical protein
VRAAAAQALGGDAEARPQLLELLRDEASSVRAAAAQALGGDAEARPQLLELLRDEASDVRAAAAEALRGDAEAKPQLLELLLHEDSQFIRDLVVKVLRKGKEPGENHFNLPPSRKLLSNLLTSALGPSSLTERIAAWVKAPRLLQLSEEEGFSVALLSWLCVRLLHASPDGSLSRGRLYGEFKPAPPLLIEPGARILMRVSMDASKLSRERFFYPTHNLLEAWRVARHLRAENPPSFFLVCAELSFEDIEAILPELKPGELRLGPTVFGFRLHQGPPVPREVSALRLFASTHASALWADTPPQERNRNIELLSSLADDPHLDIWALLPLLSRIGGELTPELRAALGRRLPASSSEAAYLRLKAAQALGVALASEPATPPSQESPQVALQRLLAPTRQSLEAAAPVTPGLVDAFFEALPLLPRGIPEQDLDDVVHLLDRVRDRTRDRQQLQRMLEVAKRLQEVALPPGTRRRLGEARHLMELSLSSRR